MKKGKGNFSLIVLKSLLFDSGFKENVFLLNYIYLNVIIFSKLKKNNSILAQNLCVEGNCIKIVS